MVWIISKETDAIKVHGHNEAYKFKDDVWFEETNAYTTISNGVILNLNELKGSNETNLFHTLYQKHGKAFPKELIGSFSGAYYNRMDKVWVIFTNHTGDHTLFYADQKHDVLCSDNIFELQECLYERHVMSGINYKAVYEILTYGLLFGEHTLLNNVFRLTAGKSICITHGKVQHETYYQLNNSPIHGRKEKDVLHELDFLFRKAVSYEYDKDEAYNLDHFASISGGLDSRMTCWVANALGYQHKLLYTFSQSKYQDAVLGEYIAGRLNSPWQFIPLDGGDYLKQVDKVVYQNSGVMSYSATATAYTSHEQLDISPFGCLHTGQVGDVMVGAFYGNEKAYATDFDFSHKVFSKRFLHKTSIDTSAYENNEIALMYGRAFNGALSGNFSLQKATGVTSPFLLPEFMDFALRIPVADRAYHKLYRKWIKLFYPEAAKIKWEAIDANLYAPVIRFKEMQIPFSKFPQMALRKAGKLMGINTLRKSKAFVSMNPFDKWLSENSSLSNFLNSYFETHLDLIEHEECRSDCALMFREGNATEKFQVLTILSFIKQLKH